MGQENSPGCRKSSPCKASDAPDRSNTPISLAQTWADQEDLKGLFQRRRQAHPDRIYTPNDNYGFGPCLRRFAGIASEESIHAIVPHGHNYPLIDGRRQAPAQERIDAIPTVLTSSDACLEAFRNVEGKRVIPIGLASLYAIHCLDPAAPPPSGSLFFRCHSTGVTQLKLDDDQLIRNLRGLPDRFHPIRICAYWRDWDLGEYEPFLAAGFRVVGAAPTAILCSSGGICTCSNHTVMCSARESAAMSFMPAFWEDQP